ncbi:MAG: EamA family transporter [Bacillota bacterium]
MTVIALIGRIILLGIERIIVKQFGKGNNSIEVTVLFFGIGVFFLLPFIIGPGINSFTFLPYAFISSCIYSLTFVLYVRALSEGEVSLVTPIASLNILFLFLISVIFLKESFTIYKAGGILLIFYGSSYLKPGTNLTEAFKSIIRENPCRYMLISTLLLAVGRTIDKAVSSNVSSLIYTFVIYFFITLNLTIYLFFKKRIKNIYHIFTKRPVLATTSGAINVFSYLFLLVALKEIEVSVAVPLTMLSSLIAVLLGKYIFKEKIKHRLIAVIIIIIGSWILLL